MAQLQLFLFLSLFFYVYSENVETTPSSIKQNVSIKDISPGFIYKIIGGTEGNKEDFPFMASLQESGVHFCGGTIYNSKYILTAAHCFEGSRLNADRFFNLYAVIGTNNLQSVDGIKHFFRQVIIHPNFNSKIFSYDIALVKLRTEIIFSDFIKPVVIDDTFIDPNVSVISIGWGRISPDGTGSPIIKFVDLITTDVKYCDRKFTVPVTKLQICVRTTMGNGSCKGDSGGALMANNKQIGITSFGGNCGNKVPEVYTRVALYIDWMQANAI